MRGWNKIKDYAGFYELFEAHDQELSTNPLSLIKSLSMQFPLNPGSMTP